MNWYIGQKVVCIKAHSEGLIEVGNKYTIQDISICKCKDNNLAFYVGVCNSPNRSGSYCVDCKHSYSNTILFLSSELFAPIEEIPESHEKAVEELLTQKLVLS